MVFKQRFTDSGYFGVAAVRGVSFPQFDLEVVPMLERQLLVFLAGCLLPLTAWAQPEISPRTVAAYGKSNGNDWVKEVDVAVGATSAMAVFIHGNRRIGYAFWSGGSWAEGVVVDEASGQNPSLEIADPSVAYDAFNDRYVVVYYRYTDLALADFYCRRFDSNGLPYLGEEPFRIFDDLPPGQLAKRADKPWVRAGESNSGIQEFYVTGFDAGPIEIVFLRSIDGGGQWEARTPVLQLGAPPIQSNFAPQVTVAGPAYNAPMYTPYKVVTGEHRWHFLKHLDAGSGTEAVFEELRFSIGGMGGGQPLTAPIEVNPNMTDPFLGPFVTGADGATKHVPYLVADPTNYDRIYLLYADLASTTPGEDDIDIFCVKIIKGQNGWLRGPPVRVNNNTLGDGTDQFQPAAVVDASGRLHVIFYDGRDFGLGDKKHDMTYAYSMDAGATFTNVELTDGPSPTPALDFNESSAPPREYPGLAVYGNTIWALFSGTSASDPYAENSVIWAARIQW